MLEALSSWAEQEDAGGHSLGGPFPVVASSTGGEGLGDEGLWGK